MAESSIWWTTGGAGDGAAPYTQAQVTAWLARMLGGDGVARGWPASGANELTPSVSGTTVNVAPGAALVQGIPYEATTTVPVSVPTPLIGTTGHRIVLRADYAARTVRIALKSSNDGVAAIPALTQSTNTTWEIALASLTITTGGTITLTDQRTWLVYNTNHVRRAGDVMTGNLSIAPGASSAGVEVRAQNFPSLALERSSAPVDQRWWEFIVSSNTTLVARIFNDARTVFRTWLSVTRSGTDIDAVNFPIGGDTLQSGGNPVLHTGNMALRVVTAWLADLAVTTAKLANLAVTEAKLAANAVTEAKLAANAVIATKIANGAVTLEKWTHPPRRQGGSATSWGATGTTNYTPANMRIQMGTILTATGTATITFPVAFSDTPLVFFETPSVIASIGMTITGTSMNIEVRNTSGALIPAPVSWLALGPG